MCRPGYPGRYVSGIIALSAVFHPRGVCKATFCKCCNNCCNVGQYSSPRTCSHCGSKLVPKLQNPTWLEGGICSPLPTAKLYVLYTMLAMIMICCPAGQAGGTPPCLACSLPCAWAAQPGKLQGPLPTLRVLQARAKSLLKSPEPGLLEETRPMLLNSSYLLQIAVSRGRQRLGLSPSGAASQHLMSGTTE